MLDNLQFLRAVAASLVVMQHSFSRGESYGFPAMGLRSLDGFGLGGVDIFFVISGFIMTYSQSRAPKTPREFILGRFVRIVPLYWSWMALIVSLIVLVPGVFRTLQIDLEHILYSTLFLSQPLLSEPPFIDLGWTLEYEMLFYMVFALTLLLGNGRVQLLVLGTAMLGFALVFGQWIVLEFLLGVTAFLLLAQMQARGLGVGLMLAGIAGFAVMHGLFADMHRLWTWGVPAFLVVLGVSAMRGRHARVLSYLGDASYSIYLVQVASIPLFYKVASVLPAPQSGAAAWGDVVSVGDLLILGSIAFSIVAGVLLHEVVEKPVTLVARRSLLQPQTALPRE
ncbi:acyltransferase family protein [Mameliella alba]|uniref:acyltransferase family protein n=1 Tax=Mameliella alba TaxID=561184 RepID=UPI0013FE25A6|nr:acyltransferase [Mameliella alba]